MRLRINTFNAVLFVLLIFSMIDFVQSDYYLNRYGFENEINPLITDNFSLTLSYIAGVPLMIFCSWLSKKFSENSKNLTFATWFIVLTITILKFVVIINNFIIILW